MRPITTEAHVEDFFEALLAAFAQTRPAQIATSRDLIIGNRPVRLTMAGCGLDHLARPLSLPTTPSTSTPELTIYAWEGPANWCPPTWPWPGASAAASLGLATRRFRINYHAPSSLLCMWDRDTRRAVYWVRRAADLPFWEIASPFRILFHWWAQSWGGQLAHAAAVGVGGRGVLLVGKSGSGKSTAALACLHQGLQFVGDDYVLLTADPVPTAHFLYASAKLQPAALANYFPQWSDHIGACVGPQAKCVLYLRDLPGIGLQSRVTLDAMILPQVTTDPLPAIEPANPRQTWLALVPSTVFQLPDARETTLAFFAAFTRRLSSFHLTTGRDLQRLPGVIRAFLSSATPAGQGA